MIMFAVDTRLMHPVVASRPMLGGVGANTVSGSDCRGKIDLAPATKQVEEPKISEKIKTKFLVQNARLVFQIDRSGRRASGAVTPFPTPRAPSRPRA
jgi:hypothetical protein